MHIKPDESQPLIGVDFSSAPNARKPIAMAMGRRHGAVVRLDGLSAFASLPAFGEWLARPGPWLGGFDFPFGLPRELVADASGDRLDAVLCLMQAASALGRPNHGWPAEVDPLEGWILSA